MGVRILTQEELVLFAQLRDCGVLKTFDFSEFAESVNGSGVVYRGCSDGDHFDERFSFLKQKLGSDRIHPLANNGGALTLTDPVPVEVQSYFFKEIIQSLSMKGMHVLLLEAHMPCGFADAHDISLQGSLARLFRVVSLVEGYMSDTEFRVVPLFHVSVIEQKRASHFTYFFDVTGYVDFADSGNASISVDVHATDFCRAV